MADSGSGRVILRPASRRDCRRLWEWRNEQAAREASFNEGYIPYKQHEHWFACRLADPNASIFIALNADGCEVGYVRFDIVGEEAEISVSIDKAKRGRGYGMAAIKIGSDHFLKTKPVQRIVAHVKRTNTSSAAVFERAGFVLRGYRQTGGIEACELVYEGKTNGRSKNGQIDRSPLVDSDDEDMREGCILFRVDAAPDIGLGHLQRCLSLAAALRDFNTDCLFLTNEEQIVHHRIKRFGFDGRTLGAIEPWGADDLTQTMAVAAAHKCGAIVVDSDYEGAGYLSQLRNAGYYVVAIEDTAPHPFPCQLVVNGDAHARQLPYQAISEDTQFLLGPEYSILRREFWEVPPRVISEHVDRILVTLGGADPYNIMPRVINVLDTLPEAFSVSVIIGPFFENFSQVQAVAQRAQRGITLVRAPDSVRDLMMEAGLAISAGGQTLYELARVGCPTVAVRMASNQDGQLAVFEDAGFLRIVGHAENDDIVEAIGAAVRTSLADPQARAAMSVAGKRLIDGQGAVRVAQTILAERVRAQGNR